MRIVRLSAQNFKRIRAIEITPEGNVVRITGRNGAGKSSVLDAIVAALGGGRMAPEKPVREGEESAYIIAQTEEYVITRKFAANGASSLEIRGDDRRKVDGPPQALLDSIVGQIAFDPLAFCRMKDVQQRETLLRLLGLDLSAHDRKIQGLRNERNTMLERKKRLDGDLQELHLTPNMPAEEVSIAALTQQFTAATDRNSEYEQCERDIKQKAVDIQSKVREIERKQAELLQIQEQLRGLGRQLEDLQAGLAGLKTVLAGKSKADTAPIKQAMTQAEETNRIIRANQKYRDAQKAVDTIAAQITDHFHKIQAAEADKARALGAVNMPVPGLSVSETGLTMNGIPFSQVNHAKKVEVSLAVGMAMNPKLRVMRVDGNGLDSETLRVIGEMADAQDYQLWMEVTNDSKKAPGIVIEDGSVAAINPENVSIVERAMASLAAAQAEATV